MSHEALSIKGVPIRLSDERWVHIVEHHDDLAGYYYDALETVRAPDAVYEGSGGEWLAVFKAARRRLFAGSIQRTFIEGRIRDHCILHNSDKAD